MAPAMVRPLVKLPGRKLKAPGAARPAKRIPRQALIDRRDQCLAEISRFRSQPDDAGSLFEKARQLLTRHWCASSWGARAGILRTAEWLIGIGKKGADSASIDPLDARVVQSLCERTGHAQARGA